MGIAQGGDEADIAKYSKRTVRVTQQHNDECKRLLQLMGVPIVEVTPSSLLSVPPPLSSQPPVGSDDVSRSQE